jgi:sugar (pentulose or hexulose) kinase
MVAAAHVFQHFKKQVASGGGLDQRAPLVATGGDVVQVALAIAAIENRHAGVLSRTGDSAL